MAYTNIDDPSAHFQVLLHGSSSNTAASYTFDGNSDMQPDLVWHKNRTYADHGYLFDSTRGIEKAIYSNLTNAEGVHNSSLSSFDSNGYSVGTSNVTSGAGTYVSWCWKANGGTTTSKSSGTVAGNVTTPCVQQVNTDAGFSILTYTASTSYAGTETHLEHGLGVGPKVLIVKRRDTAGNLNVYHAGNGASPNAGYGYLLLNTANATQVASPSNQYWLNTPAESNATLLALGAENGANGGQYVCYAFAEKQGYSKFGSYVGNGNADGPFIYTGFKPAWIMLKDTESSGDNWQILDTKRDPDNPQLKYVQADNDTAEGNFTFVDILSNGFKFRSTYSVGPNVNGHKTIYMAFAEHPFTTSTRIPTTAR